MALLCLGVTNHTTKWSWGGGASQVERNA